MPWESGSSSSSSSVSNNRCREEEEEGGVEGVHGSDQYQVKEKQKEEVEVPTRQFWQKVRMRW